MLIPTNRLRMSPEIGGLSLDSGPSIPTFEGLPSKSVIEGRLRGLSSRVGIEEQAGTGLTGPVYWCAVRQTSDTKTEWVDFDTHSCCADDAFTAAMKNNTKIPAWAANNPVVRVGRFQVVEVKENP